MEKNMPWSIESALDDVAIEKTETTGQGYSFWLKGIPVEIQVALFVNPAHGGFNFHLSHFIHTPKQIDPYHPWGDDQAYALHLAVTAITQHYKEATNAGLAPCAKWLVPNERGI
jgi:hypothetical protein